MFKHLDPLIGIFNHAVLVCRILNEKLEFFFFSGKIVTSLTYTFTMEKALVKIIFCHKIFICQPFFKTFVALFTTFGMQKDDKIAFCLKCFRTR